MYVCVIYAVFSSITWIFVSQFKLINPKTYILICFQHRESFRFNLFLFYIHFQYTRFLFYLLFRLKFYNITEERFAINHHKLLLYMFSWLAPKNPVTLQRKTKQILHPLLIAFGLLQTSSTSPSPPTCLLHLNPRHYNQHYRLSRLSTYIRMGFRDRTPWCDPCIYS